MNIKRCHSISAAVCLVVQISLYGAEPPTLKSNNSAMHDMLIKQGYTSVPIIKSKATGIFFVEFKCGKESWLMELDTTTQPSCLDEAITKKLGLRIGKEIPLSSNSSIKIANRVMLSNFYIGGFNSRDFSSEYEFYTADFSTMKAKYRNDKTIDGKVFGVLGQSILLQLSAVIDYGSSVLYLQPPINKIWSQLEGEWISESIVEEGKSRTPLQDNAVKIIFKNKTMHIKDNNRDYNYAFHILDFDLGYRLAMFDTEKKQAIELEYETGGIMKFEENYLVMCISLDSERFKGMPKDFTVSADSGRILIKLKKKQ